MTIKPSFSFSFLLTLFLLLATPRVGFGGCEDELVNFALGSGNPVSEPGSVFGTREKTVAIIGKRKGRHGGERLVVQATKEWFSLFSESRRAPQGDPRSFLDILGPDGARFFGFEMLNETSMTIPDAAEFNGALEKINARLVAEGKPPLAVKFYSQSEVKVGPYNERFRNGELPIAAGGTHLIHDMSFHMAAIFIPREVIEHSAVVSNEIEAFAEAMKAHLRKLAGPNRSAEAEEAIKAYSVLVKNNITEGIDDGTGELGNGLLNFVRSQKYGPRSDKDEASFARRIQQLYSFRFHQDIEPTEKFTAASAILTLPTDGYYAPSGGARDIQAQQVRWKINAAIQPAGFDFGTFKKEYVAANRATRPGLNIIPTMGALEACEKISKTAADVRRIAAALELGSGD